MLPWDAPDTARLLAGEAPTGALRSALADADVTLAWTRNPDLVAALRARTRRVVDHDPTPGGSGHAAAWLSQPLRQLGVEPPSGPTPPLVFTGEETRAAERVAGSLPIGFLAVHPGSGSPAKSWPAEAFAALVSELSPGRPWLLILGPAEGEGPPPLRRVPGAVPARELPPRTLAALVARAGLYVGSDSGVSHLAAAAGAPTLALFGPTDPAVWAPLGPKVAVVRSPDATMTGLDLAGVLAAAQRMHTR